MYIPQGTEAGYQEPRPTGLGYGSSATRPAHHRPQPKDPSATTDYAKRIWVLLVSVLAVLVVGGIATGIVLKVQADNRAEAELTQDRLDLAEDLYDLEHGNAVDWDD